MKIMTIKLPKIEDIEFSIECLEEYEHPNNSFALDDETQEEVVNSILKDLNNGNEWAWCSIRVNGSYKNILKASDYLGCCSYESEEDFIKNSEYYEDMKEVIYQDIIKQLESLSID